jgi:hypothetical protein
MGNKVSQELELSGSEFDHESIAQNLILAKVYDHASPAETESISGCGPWFARRSNPSIRANNSR